MYLGYFLTIPDSFCDILRKQPTFQDAKGGFLARWRLRNERRNSILMTSHYLGMYHQCFRLVEICFIQSEALSPDLDSDALSVWNFWAGFPDVISQVNNASGGVAKCQLFSQVTFVPARNPYRTGLSVKTSARWVDDFGAISVTERRCPAPVSKVESHILDRCSHFSSTRNYPMLVVWTYIASENPV